MADLPVYEPLRVYVDATSTEDVEKVATDWSRAVGLIAKLLLENDCEVGDVDADVLEGAIVDVGAELYARRNAPFGVTTFATGDGTVATRVSADPMVRARATLEPWFAAGFA
jgi:hypothetical protein